MNSIPNSAVRTSAKSKVAAATKDNTGTTTHVVQHVLKLSDVLRYANEMGGVVVGLAAKNFENASRIDIVLKARTLNRRPVVQWSHSERMQQLLAKFYKSVFTYEEHKIAVLATREMGPHAGHKVNVNFWECNLQGTYSKERNDYHTHKEALTNSEIFEYEGVAFRRCTLDK